MKAASSDERVLVPPSHVGGAGRTPAPSAENACPLFGRFTVRHAITPSKKRLVDILRP